MPMSNENWLKPEVVEQATAAPGELREMPQRDPVIQIQFSRELLDGLSDDEAILALGRVALMAYQSGQGEA